MRSVLVAVLLATSPAAAQITVTSAADAAANDGACTLREAIVAANTDTASGGAAGECAAGAGADTVTLALAPGTVVTMTADLPTITEAITVDGGGAVVDGAGAFRLVDFDPSPAGETITLRRLTLNAVLISACSASTYGLNRLPRGTGIPPGGRYPFTVSAGCWDVDAGSTATGGEARQRMTVSAGGTTVYTVTG